MRRIWPLVAAVDRVRGDLRLIGRSPEEQVARTVLLCAFGLFLGPWLGLFAWVSGTVPPPALLGAISLIGGMCGALQPWTSLRAIASRRRRDLLLALAAWCDLLAMSLAAGRGIEQAVTTAALAGDGWAFGELRGALSAGHVRSETPWATLDQLGSNLGIGDLRELAATIAMAGEDGAAVRDAVTTKARTLRERISADIERDAERATAEMGMPTVTVAFGFLIFLGYPAVLALSNIGP
jgi:Flp pilus assembly protein TadB